tara:strand:- start:1496 stop:1972 length:477 start_codon:yes stop_codon:yes gene_type:complete
MKESLGEANEELKRVEHLVHVSLKYTRTVDVLMNTLSRMVDAYDHLLDALLKYAAEQGMIEEAPTTPKEKADVTKKLFKKEELVTDNVGLYTLFRQVLKSNPERINEYRRHVTLITFVHGNEIQIHIDNITDYFHIQKDFYNYISQLVTEAQNTEEES